jgi:hypothetical protein
VITSAPVGSIGWKALRNKNPKRKVSARSVKASDGAPVLRQSRVDASAVDPNWVLKQLAVQGVTPPQGTRRQP